MFKSHTKTYNVYSGFFSKSNSNKCFKSNKITSYHLRDSFSIHTGNSFIRRSFNYLFIGRSIKFNTFFKKPLVRPIKRGRK